MKIGERLRAAYVHIDDEQDDRDQVIFGAGGQAALRALADLIDEHNADRNYAPEYWSGPMRARLMSIQVDQRVLAAEARRLADEIRDTFPCPPHPPIAKAGG